MFIMYIYIDMFTFCLNMCRTDARLRRTDAHDSNYIIMMDMERLHGRWMGFAMV